MFFWEIIFREKASKPVMFVGLRFDVHWDVLLRACVGESAVNNMRQLRESVNKKFLLSDAPIVEQSTHLLPMLFSTLNEMTKQSDLAVAIPIKKVFLTSRARKRILFLFNIDVSTPRRRPSQRRRNVAEEYPHACRFRAWTKKACVVGKSRNQRKIPKNPRLTCSFSSYLRRE